MITRLVSTGSPFLRDLSPECSWNLSFGYCISDALCGRSASTLTCPHDSSSSRLHSGLTEGVGSNEFSRVVEDCSLLTVSWRCSEVGDGSLACGKRFIRSADAEDYLIASKKMNALVLLTSKPAGKCCLERLYQSGSRTSDHAVCDEALSAVAPPLIANDDHEGSLKSESSGVASPGTVVQVTRCDRGSPSHCYE